MNLIDTRQTAARAFVRTLNILLKFARLYGFDHAKTNDQFETAWSELHTAIAITKEAGLLLGARGSQLLLDGLPVEATPVERSFAEFLSAAGLAGIHFTSSATKDDLERLIRAFHSQTGKPSALVAQLKASRAGTNRIRIHESRFVLGDTTTSEERKALQLVTENRSADVGSLKGRQAEAPKSLRPTVPADGLHGEPRVPLMAPDSGHSNGGEIGAGTRLEASAAVRRTGVAAGPDGGSRSNRGGLAAGSTTTDEEILGILDQLNPLGHPVTDGGGGAHAGPLRDKLASLLQQSREALREALADIAGEMSAAYSKAPTLLRQTDHLATPLATERPKRVEIKVKSVGQMRARAPQKVESQTTVVVAD